MGHRPASSLPVHVAIWVFCALMVVGWLYALDLPSWLGMLLAAGASMLGPLVSVLLRENEARMEARRLVQDVIDAIPQPVCIKDENSCYLTLNEAYARERGLPRDTLIGMDSTRPPNARDPAMQALVRAEDLRVLGGEPVFKEESRPHPDSGVERVRLISKGLCRQRGNRRMIVCSIQDITQSRLAERQLQEALKREQAHNTEYMAFVQRILDQIPYPVFVKDARGMYVLVNKALAAERGSTCEALIGQTSVLPTSTPEHAALVESEDAAVLAGKTISKEEHISHHVFGQVIDRFVTKGRCVDTKGIPVIVGTYVDVTALRTAERAVQESLRREAELRERAQAFTQRLIDVIPAPVYVKDENSVLLMVNDAYVRDRGRPREEILLHSSVERASDSLREQVLSEDRRVLQGEVVYREAHMQYPDGREKYLIVSKGSCLNAEGRSVLVGSNFDISTLRTAERELVASLEREKQRGRRVWNFMQRVLDIIPISIYVKDAASRYLIVNQTLLAERRVAAEQLIGLAPEQIDADPEWVRIVMEEDARILQGDKVYKEECRPHRLTGDDRYRIISKGRVEDAEGNPVIVVANIDVTELRTAERKAQEALEAQSRVREFLQSIFDVQPGPIYVEDQQGNLLMVNRAFANLLGKPHTSLIGRNVVSMCPPGMAQAIARCHEQLGQLGEGRIFETEIHMEGEQERHFMVRAADGPGIDGQPVLVGVLSDVTTLRAAEVRSQQAMQAADEANRAKSLFLASMSHEIRTPISGVIGTLRLAMRERDLQGTAQDLVGTALSNAQSLLGIINDILDFSKIEAGQLTLENVDFDLRSIIRHSMSAFRDHLAERSLQFIIDIDSTLPPYYKGDPTRLRQVLINLVGNAIKFTREGQIALRIVKLHAKSDDSVCWMRFRVEDTGIGIPTDALPRMFQKFQQADVTTTRKYGGTGLGLAICKELVEKMGGAITVSSQEGVGTTFEFCIPLPLGEAPPRPENDVLEPHEYRLRVLCAEDYPANQLIVRALMETMGHEIEIVGDGRAAVEILSRKNYDVVLMDSRMPVMDGLDASRAIRAGGIGPMRVRDPDILIIALTANASTSDRTACLQAGMNDYLTKPIDEMRLHQKLGWVIEQRLAKGIRLDPQAGLTPAEPVAVTPLIPEAPVQLASGAAPQAEAAAPAPARPRMSARLQALFFEALPQRIAELDEAVAARDFPTISRHAHGLKGTVAHFGGEHIQPVAAELEDASDRADDEGIARAHSSLRAALHDLLITRQAGDPSAMH